MNDIDIAQFVKERDEVLLSMDESKIRAYHVKHNGYDPFVRFGPEVFWLSVHKAITGALSLPREFRLKSKAWLNERGSHSLDGGDLD